MSIELHVFLQRKRVPTASEWFNRLKEAGFNITMDPNTNLEEQAGFMPMLHDGCKTGFEFDLGDVEEWMTEIDEIKSTIGDRNTVLQIFDLRARTKPTAANPAALHVGERILGGVFYDPQTESSVLVDKVDLTSELASHKPSYWMLQSPQVRTIPGRKMLDANQLKIAIRTAAKLYEDFESKITPSSATIDLVNEAESPYVQLLGFTILALTNKSAGPALTRQPVLRRAGAQHPRNRQNY